MTESEFENLLREALGEWIGSEESYDDNPYLRVDPATFEVVIVDGEDTDDDEDSFDYFPVLELVAPSAEGGWVPDEEALKAVSTEYFG